MRYYHRHSFFPLVVIVLSVLLAGLIYWSVQQEAGGEVERWEGGKVEESVDPAVYRDSLAQIVGTFEERMSSSQDDLDKLLAAQTALAGLLELRVPAEFKDLHLALAVAFSDIEDALQSQDRNIDSSLAQINELEQTYPWLFL
ncbi:MAG: hypothetical protein UY76_C0037G0003 [Candidatus Uhrbacteria bacterium GW2011_GWA2_52_8d]|uniref:Uncharacterized protein n=1 Tax=Candidatus Uhrbacteria bacterium GW2011_GWA2_52_8d TaxID=1618979 RepID=A0A0G1XMV2_9BACT|nr:MAG: hypothetical protein UY76_C0037G0003 [Candidatus Uhrbacteria bacterium GW2011_GWA2_52_8d]